VAPPAAPQEQQAEEPPNPEAAMVKLLTDKLGARPIDR
jgi:hypothetical protein